MRLWLDTANIDEIKTAVSWGVISGVTTNPSLVAKEGFKVPFKKVVKTICDFSANQALLAGRAGAAYVSPFLGRLDDIGNEGMQIVRDIVEIFRNYDDIKTQVIAASIRNPIHVIDAAKAGADVATIPFSVVEQMLKHPLTDIGIQRFSDDWKKSGISFG